LATKNEIVKILGRGELKKLKVTAHKFTATAKAAIEAAGGEAVIIFYLKKFIESISNVWKIEELKTES
jgi:ribosomal protein L18E